jgi:hypothetical protein
MLETTLLPKLISMLMSTLCLLELADVNRDDEGSWYMKRCLIEQCEALRLDADTIYASFKSCVRHRIPRTHFRVALKRVLIQKEA